MEGHPVSFFFFLRKKERSFRKCGIVPADKMAKKVRDCCSTDFVRVRSIDQNFSLIDEALLAPFLDFFCSLREENGLELERTAASLQAALRSA